jgi:hypothetical protein
MSPHRAASNAIASGIPAIGNQTGVTDLVALHLNEWVNVHRPTAINFKMTDSRPISVGDPATAKIRSLGGLKPGKEGCNP